MRLRNELTEPTLARSSGDPAPSQLTTSRREFLIRAAALGLTGSALAIFLEACKTVDSLSLAPTTPPPTPHASSPAPTVTPFPTVMPTSTASPASTHLPDPTRPVTDTPEAVSREPLEPAQVGIGHLLRRAGFGASRAELKQFTDMGRSAAIDHLIDYESVDDQQLEQRLDALNLAIRFWLTKYIYCAMESILKRGLTIGNT